MKRNFLSVMLGICVVTVMAAACGKNPAANTVSSGGAISGGAISGGVVSSGVVADSSASGGTISTSAVNESSVQTEESTSESHVRKLGKIENKKFRYANDRNIYEGDCDQGIYQYDLNGKEEHYYDMREVVEKDIYPEILWVDNECIFVSCHMGQEYYEIWRIPVSKTKSKKRLQVDKWKKLAEADRLDCMITKTDQEIFYCADAKVYRLNLKTKETQELATGIDVRDCHVARDSNGIPLVQDRMAYIRDDQKGKMYQLDLAKWELRDFGTNIGTDLSLCYILSKHGYYTLTDDGTMENYRKMGNIGTDGAHFYYMTDDGMMKYNRKTGKTKTLFTRKELKDQLAGTKFPETDFIYVFADEIMDSSYVTSVFYHQNRLYIVMEAFYGEEEAIDRNGDYYAGEFVRFLYSCSASDGTDLRYEKAATEYLWKHSAAFKDAYAEISWTEMTGKFLYFIDGCIVMDFDKKGLDNEKYHTIDERKCLVMYDPVKGTFREIKKNTKEYGKLKASGYTWYEEPHC